MSEQIENRVGTIVVGSGGAALAAALTASEQGSDVVVFEASEWIGGTTSISGGQPWIPRNERMLEEGLEDSREDVMSYLDAVTAGRAPDQDRLEAFVDNAPEAISYLEAISPVRFNVCRTYSDYHADLPGGKRSGRSMDVAPFGAREALGEWNDRIRENLQIPAMTVDEMGGAIDSGDPKNAKTIAAGSGTLNEVLVERMAAREAEGIRTCGGALIASLLRGALDRGIAVHTGTPVKHLLFDGPRVSGVTVEVDGDEVEVEATDGVILAAGGFEWNRDMVRSFLGVPEVLPISPPCNYGDGLRMGLEAGADLANMSVAWAYPVVSTGEEEIEGAPLHLLNTPRQEPGVIVVNRKGQRFGNEAVSYMHFGKYHRIYDPVNNEWPNEPPVWLVFDETVRNRTALKDFVAGAPTPKWVKEASTIKGLAAQIDVPVENLVETVANWNKMVAIGEDTEFGRGTVWFEGWTSGGPDQERMLAPIDSGPYYAMQLFDGVIGTAGGLRTDGHGRVRSMNGGTVEGLYAAGNTAANVFGPGYPAGGATIGQGLTFGYLAGKDAARRGAGLSEKVSA
jgi:3-oxosteroid 1-dehydrogenase